MASLGGYAERIVLFNLAESAVEELSWSREEVLPFIGGRGLAASLLYRLLPPRIDPLGPENLLIFAAGPMLKEYYQVREWDLKTGKPAPRRLEALGLK